MTRSDAMWLALLGGIALFVSVARADDARKSSAPTVTVSKDGRALEITRPPETKAVRVPVLDRCGDPVPGPPKIRDVQVNKYKVVATYGKHCWATISLRTLAIECSGCD